MNAPAKTPAIGDNVRQLVTVAELDKEFANVEKFVAELEAEAAKVPPYVEDDEDLGIVNEIAPKLAKAAKRVDTLRDETKRPHLDAGRVIDGWFKAIEKRCKDLQAALEKRGTAYLKKKQAAAEALRQAEEAKAREEAARLQADSAAAMKAGDADKFVAAHAAATAAEAKAEEAAAPVKAADLARTQTAAGTATLQETWSHEIDDLSKIDLNMLRPHFTYDEINKAVRGFVRTNQDKRPLAGVRIFRDTKARFTA